MNWKFGDKSNCTWRVVSTIGIGVLWLGKDTGGHLVFPDRRLLLIGTQGDIGAAARRAQNPGMKETFSNTRKAET